MPGSFATIGIVLLKALVIIVAIYAVAAVFHWLPERSPHAPKYTPAPLKAK